MTPEVWVQLPSITPSKVWWLSFKRKTPASPIYQQWGCSLMGRHLACNQGCAGSIPVTSTTIYLQWRLRWI